MAKRIRGVRLTREERLEVRLSSVEAVASKRRLQPPGVQRRQFSDY